MTGREGRQGTVCVSHLQTRELKSTHQVKTLFDLLPPHHPQVPVEDKWMNGDIFYYFFWAFFFVAFSTSEASRGHSCFSGKETGLSDVHTNEKTENVKKNTPEKFPKSTLFNYIGQCLWVCFSFCRQSSSSPFFSPAVFLLL